MLPRVNIVRGDGADYMLFSTRDIISVSIYLNGSWDEHIRSVSRMFYHEVEAPLIVDIGANLGGYTIPVAKEIAGSGGVVYSFEPQRIIFYQLCGNVFLNRLDNVHLHYLAVGEVDGTVTIPEIDYNNSANIGRFSIDPAIHNVSGYQESVNVTQGAGVEVPLVRLDSCRFPKAPSLIKIDVEGLELQVLRGGVNVLKQWSYPPILLEAWKAEWFAESRRALIDFIHELGYTTFEIGEDVIAQHPEFNRFIDFKVEDDGRITMYRTR